MKESIVSYEDDEYSHDVLIKYNEKIEIINNNIHVDGVIISFYYGTITNCRDKPISDSE